MIPWELAAAFAASALLAILAAAMALAKARRKRACWRDDADAVSLDARAARGDAAALLRQVDELAARADEAITPRMKELRELICQADQAAARLRREMHACGSYMPALSDPRHLKIQELHRQGLTAAEIARRVEMTVGEVELVLNLDRARQATEKLSLSPASAPSRE